MVHQPALLRAAGQGLPVIMTSASERQPHTARGLAHDAKGPSCGVLAVFLSHLHADHTGDLAGLLLYPWGVRVRPDGPVPPVQVYGPGRAAPDSAGRFETVMAAAPAG